MEINDDLIRAVNDSSDADSLVHVYILLRDEEESRKRIRTEEDEPLKKLKDTIETKLQKQLQDSNLERMGTTHGTVYKTKKTAARVADWNVLLAWIQKHSAWDMFKKDVNKTAVEARMEETGKPVPGVDWTVFETIGVRRK